MEPFLPFTSATLLKMLDLEPKKWKDFLGKQILRPGHQLREPALLFEKIEDAVIDVQLQKLEKSKAMNQLSNATVTPSKPSTSFDDFQKMDLRVGTIVSAERVPKTDKLLKLTIDTGIDTRTCLLYTSPSPRDRTRSRMPSSA